MNRCATASSSRRTSFVQAELSYAEVVELFATRFVSPGADVEIDFEEGGCNLATALIVPQPSQQQLSRIHRFERLRRKLGWSFYELDRAIAAFQPGEINNDLLVALSGFRRVRRSSTFRSKKCSHGGRPSTRASIDPRAATSSPRLYQRVFQNPVVFDAQTLAIFALDEAANELTHSGEALADHLPSLAAALGARTEDLQLAVAADATLSLATLSELSRVVSFARALRIPVRDLLTFRPLSAHDPFASPAETMRFHQHLIETIDAGFTVPQIAYLLRHTESPGVPVAPTDTEIGGEADSASKRGPRDSRAIRRSGRPGRRRDGESIGCCARGTSSAVCLRPHSRRNVRSRLKTPKRSSRSIFLFSTLPRPLMRS